MVSEIFLYKWIWTWIEWLKWMMGDTNGWLLLMAWHSTNRKKGLCHLRHCWQLDTLTLFWIGLATKRNLFHGAYALLVFSDIIHTLDCLHLFLFAPKIRKRVGSVKWCQKARKRNNSRVQNWCDRQTNVYNTIMMTWWQNNSLLMAWRNGTWDECTDRKRWFGKHTHKTNHIMLLNGFTNTMKSISQLKWVGTESKIEQ